MLIVVWHDHTSVNAMNSHKECSELQGCTVGNYKRFVRILSIAMEMIVKFRIIMNYSTLILIRVHQIIMGTGV